MERETRRADEIQPRQYVIDTGIIQLVTYVQTVETTTMLVFASQLSVCGGRGRHVELATADEVFSAAAEAQATGRRPETFPADWKPPIGPVAEVFGPMYADEPAGEFGPESTLDDLVDAALDGSRPALEELATRPRVEPPKPAPLGWPLGDGHRTPAPTDAMTHSRDYNGGTEA